MPANDERLLVRLEANATKLERELKRAVGIATKQANKMDASFNRANGRIEKGFKSAASSASVFERELAKSDRQLDNLRASIDPVFASTRDLAAQQEILASALARGAITSDEHARATQLLNAQYKALNVQQARAVKGFRGMSTATRGGAGGIQNVAFQVGDFATQVGAGTAASVALGQQLPQLLGGFGSLGAVLGAVVAIGVPLGAFLLSTRERSATLEDALENLNAAVSAYESAAKAAIIPTAELERKYQDAAGAARVFLSALRDIAEVNVLDALTESVDKLTGLFSETDLGLAPDLDVAKSLNEQMTELIRNLSDPALSVEDKIKFQTAFDELNRFNVALTQLQVKLNSFTDDAIVTEGQTLKVAAALAEFGAAEGPADQADAAARLLGALQDTLGPISGLNEEGRNLVEALADAGEAAATVSGKLNEAEDEGTALKQVLGSIDMSHVTGQAISLADQLGVTLEVAERLNAVLNANAGIKTPEQPGLSFGGPGVSDPTVGNQPLEFGPIQENFRRNLSTTPTIGSSRRGSGGRSGGGSRKEAEDFFEASKRQVEALKRQIEEVGKSEREVTKLRAAYELLDEAKKRNLDLDQQQGQTGETLREQIDRQAESIANLTQEYQDAEKRAEFFNDANEQLKDGFLDAIVSGQDLAGVLEGLAKSFARAALEAAIFGTGPLAGGSSGGSGGVFSGIAGAISGLFGGNSNAPSGGAGATKTASSVPSVNPSTAIAQKASSQQPQKQTNTLEVYIKDDGKLGVIAASAGARGGAEVIVKQGPSMVSSVIATGKVDKAMRRFGVKAGAQ